MNLTQFDAPPARELDHEVFQLIPKLQDGRARRNFSDSLELLLLLLVGEVVGSTPYSSCGAIILVRYNSRTEYSTLECISYSEFDRPTVLSTTECNRG